MKNFIVILFLLIIISACGKKGDPVYKESRNQIDVSKIL